MKGLVRFFGKLIGIHFTPDNHVTPIFRLGRYHRVESSRFCWIVPLFDQALPPVKTSIHVGNFVFDEVLTKDNVPFRIHLTILFIFNPTLALRNAAAQLVQGGDNLLLIIVKDYTNQGLRRLIAHFEAEELSRQRSLSMVERNLTRLLMAEMRVLGIAPLKNDGLLIKEIIAAEKFQRAVLNARRLELILQALARFPIPGLIGQAIQAGFITNLEDLENLTLFLSELPLSDTMSLPQILDINNLPARKGQNGHSRS